MNNFRKGILDGLPIGLGYLAVSFSFGIMGTNAGLAIWQTVLISMLNVTSAGQFAGLNIMAAAGSYVEMIISQLVINSRYSLMSVSLSQSVDKSFTTKIRLLFGQFVTDEIYAVASSRGEEIGKRYFLGLCSLPYIGWSLGTLLGAVCGDILPGAISTALNVALYGMFIAIFIPPMKKALSVTVVVLISVAISIFLYFQPFFEISSGISVIICAVVSSVIGAIFFPIKDEEPGTKDGDFPTNDEEPGTKDKSLLGEMKEVHHGE
ncbi:MAG: AzlC family ABC transporter permease [Lachnospiraceae bacterium]|nr:AzlC family ABC transporter permease [Lachnospiraceae bacterium]